MKRKVAFKPRQKPMKPSGPLGRRHALRKQSQKRAAESKIYSVRRREFLELNPACQLCCVIFGDTSWHEATEVHHVELRGKNYLREETWKAACSTGHRWVHENAKAARVLGLLK